MRRTSILLFALLLGGFAIWLYINRGTCPDASHSSCSATTFKTHHNNYHISSLSLRPLSFKQSYSYLDSASVRIGLLSGEYDTSIRESRTYEIQAGILALPAIDSTSPVRYIGSMRDYLYRLIPVACDTGDIPHTLETDDTDTIIQRLSRMEYQGTCTEHAIISQRLLQHRMTTIVYTLKKNKNELYVTFRDPDFIELID